ncbi:MAG: alanine--tRNA ligase-related protein [Thermoplasmata archaeon]|nr:alanyl-tRNA editing protein [Thermoplasmata archaeon]
MELFYEEPYLRALDVNVIEKNEEYLIFDKTIIYPGGGGQPPDSGYFIGDSFKARIPFAKRENGKILHKYELIEGKISDHGKIVLDWERRYALMKMHTAEHILYRSIENLFNVKFQKVELHENESLLFINGNISIDDISRAEDLANSIVEKNIPLKFYYGNIEDVEDDVRIRKDRIKNEKIRIVEIEGFDKSACSGIHVKSTSEVGIIFVKSIKKSDFFEIKFLSGETAKNFIFENARIVRKLYLNYNIDQSKIEEKIFNSMTMNEKFKKDLFEISSSMFNFQLIEKNGKKLYYSDFPHADIKGVEKRARKMLENEKATVIYGNENDEKIFILSSELVDKELIKKIMEENNLKGGGQGNYFLIAVKKENFKKIFDELLKKFS